jgi:hypothetical protein
MTLDLIEETREHSGATFHLKIMTLENAIIAFFYEGEMKLGTLAFSMPIGFEERIGKSSVLLGGKYLVASRTLSERLASHYKKMSLVSFHSSFPETEAFRVYLQILEDRIRPTDLESVRNKT